MPNSSKIVTTIWSVTVGKDREVCLSTYDSLEDARKEEYLRNLLFEKEGWRYKLISATILDMRWGDLWSDAPLPLKAFCISYEEGIEFEKNGGNVND